MNDTTNLVHSTTHESTPPNVIEYILIHNGEATYTVRKDFYDSVRRQVQDILPALIPGERYTLEMLYGKQLWTPLSDGVRRMAGRCMVDMVAKNLLPLRFAESRHEYPKYYQLA